MIGCDYSRNVVSHQSSRISQQRPPSSRISRQQQQHRRRGHPVRCNRCRKALSGTVFVLSCNCIFCEGKIWNGVWSIYFILIIYYCHLNFLFRMYVFALWEESELSQMQPQNVWRTRHSRNHHFKTRRTKQAKRNGIQNQYYSKARGLVGLPVFQHSAAIPGHCPCYCSQGHQRNRFNLAPHAPQNARKIPCVVLIPKKARPVVLR